MVDTSALATDINSLYGTDMYWGIVILAFVILIFKLFWYALAVYKTVEKKQKKWFVALFILAIAPISDLGIVAIIYLLINRDKSKKVKK